MADEADRAICQHLKNDDSGRLIALAIGGAEWPFGSTEIGFFLSDFPTGFRLRVWASELQP